MPDFRTPRLTLRPLRQADATGLHAFFSDPVAMRYFHSPHRDLAETERWVAGTLAEPSGKTCEYSILRAGAVIGRAGIWKAPEIGFFLRRADWGKGYMTEALGHLLPHFFQVLDLPHIRADVDPDNIACLAMLQRLGFAETGRAARTILIDGVWADSIYLTLPRP